MKQFAILHRTAPPVARAPGCLRDAEGRRGAPGDEAPRSRAEIRLGVAGNPEMEYGTGN
jgi:hypothetical protein